MDCNPAAIAIGLTTDAGSGGVEKLRARCDELSQRIGLRVCNASIATQDALNALGAKRVAVMTPFNAEIDQIVKTNIEAGGFEVVAIKGTEAPSLPAICETPLDQIRDVIAELAQTNCDAIAQIGTALPLVEILEELEQSSGKKIVACNAAVYWQTLRAAGVTDSVDGYGSLLRDN